MKKMTGATTKVRNSRFPTAMQLAMLEYLLQFEDPLEVARDRWIFEQGADHGDEFQHALESLRQEDHAEQNYPLDEAYAQNQKNEMTMQL